MDPIIHAGLSALVAHKKTGWTKKIWPFVFFGVLPDVYGIVAVGLFLLGIQHQLFDNYFYAQYNLSHSLIVFFIVWIIINVVLKKIYWPLAFYGLHIIIDLISHQRYLTPIFWPLINYKVRGLFEYAEPMTLLITYAIAVPIFAFFILQRYFHKHPDKKNERPPQSD